MVSDIRSPVDFGCQPVGNGQATEDVSVGEEKTKMDNCPDGEIGSRKQ